MPDGQHLEKEGAVHEKIAATQDIDGIGNIMLNLTVAIRPSADDVHILKDRFKVLSDQID